MNNSDESIQRRTRKFINKYYNEASLVLEAIDETVDQDILIELTNPGYYKDYRVKAIKYIDEEPEENQRLFNRLANEDLDKKVRTAALTKINSESTSNQLLFIELAKSGHLEAIKKIKSENILAEIACNTSSDKIFQEAVTNVHDEEILTDIGFKFPESETCTHIVDNVSNQDVLTEIICHNSSFKICYEAFQKITNLSSFNRIAIECEFYQFRAASIEKINDEIILESIFNNDENDYVRLCALEKCKSVELLTRIIENDKYDNQIIFEYALDNINDDNILKQAFEKTSHSNKREIIPKIKDKSFLAEIAYNYENEYIRELALNSLMENTNKNQNIYEKYNLDMKTKMYIEILEEKLQTLEDFPESYLSFSHVENNCIYLNLTAYIDPIYFKFSKIDESWDYFRSNNLATKYRPFDFKFDVKISIKYDSYSIKSI